MSRPLRALFFGAIGTLVETSQMQRESFNAAFAAHGLDWHWDEETYRSLLEVPGGRARIAGEAARRGQQVDAAAIHATKEAEFAQRARQGLDLRPGVADCIEAARRDGLRLGFVTGTGPETVALLREGLVGKVDFEAFDFIGDRRKITRPKPDPEIYLCALRSLSLRADEVLAIEDTPESARAACAAGCRTIGFPGWAAAERSFPTGVRVVSDLSPSLWQDAPVV